MHTWNNQALRGYDKCVKYVPKRCCGVIIGAVISWRIYNMQKKTSNKQDETFRLINTLEKSHDKVLKSMQQVQKYQEKLLNVIVSLDKKINP